VQHHHNGVNVGGVRGERIFYYLSTARGVMNDHNCSDDHHGSDGGIRAPSPITRSADGCRLSMLPDDKSPSTRTLFLSSDSGPRATR